MRFNLLLIFLVTLSCLLCTTHSCKVCMDFMTEAKERCMKEGVSTGCKETQTWLINAMMYYAQGDFDCEVWVTGQMLEYWDVYILKRFSDPANSDPGNMCYCGIPWICYKCMG
ncbi:hypothetical protein L596_016844 [Steinernema carpocapsae]|uniref:Saposin B-type domain-containing protein n=1 Tax=Steinernema carpocapsae TaxID=34508 RepID=A0A4U5NJ67_STECR|nr:hypothetical protein L596_016844 [Steinernema carpocapsae]